MTEPAPGSPPAPSASRSSESELVELGRLLNRRPVSRGEVIASAG